MSGAWLFWIIAGALTALAAGLLVRPLLREREAAAGRAAYDLPVYKDQLGEVDRDLDRGIITEEEAKAARLEIERRLLGAAAAEGKSADGDTPSAPGAAQRGRRNRWAAVAVSLLLPVAALGIYLLNGAPGVPSVPRAERKAEIEQKRELDDLTQRLRTHLESEPNDPRGWELLGRNYIELGRYDQAAAAYTRAVEVGGDSATLHAALGETLTLVSDGIVGPDAQAAFARAVERDPREPRARFYLGLAQEQAGEVRAALQSWIALARETPDNAPWRPMLLTRIAQAAASAGMTAEDLAALPPAPPPQASAPQANAPQAAAPGPSRADVEAAGEMSPEEQQAFIRSMVDRLAERLEATPDDLDGWLRLARAYLVLGERDKALEALEHARPLTKDLAPDDPQRRMVEESLHQLGVAPGDG